MTNRKKSGLVAVAVVVLVGVFMYYQTANKVLDGGKKEEPIRKADQVPPGTRPVQAVAVFDTPGEPEEIRFTILLDAQGAVSGIKTEDVRSGQASDKQEVFSQELLRVIQGKNLREVGPVDKVGTSSLTTKAFNDSLDELKAQL